MNEISPQEIDELTSHYRKLVASQKTCLISSTSTEGIPTISYAPYVRDHAGRFYIYVSKMAKHTGNLLNNPKVSIMFIRPESESRNLFARERAVLDCTVEEISRNTQVYTGQLQALQEKFGKVVDLLSTLPDFHLFVLQPESGRYVAGFGQAFTIDVSQDRLKR